jgi:hypothetical protein
MLLDVSDLPHFRIRGTLVSICEEKKCAHELSRFMSSSAKKFCRLCLDDLACRHQFNTPESWAKFLPFEYLSAVQGEKVPEGKHKLCHFF